MVTRLTTVRSRGGRWPGILAGLAILLLAVAALIMAGAGPAYRGELVSLGEAFNLLRNGVYAAGAAIAISIITLLFSMLVRRSRPAFIATLVIVAAAALLYIPWQHWQRAQQVPAIHDITTDTQNPPAFEALADAREAAPNAVDYPGDTTAQQQQAAYPYIKPLILDEAPQTVLAAAQAEAEEAGWRIARITDNHIEATATTRWFGFEDDVVIRLTEIENGVQVDMRSASRLGASDVGTNAARIEAFLTSLEARLK
ncbi:MULTISPECIES: DUF1499 domain-containing protein [unclassified Halomonas]|uniref:DUF1499 domain-containing protein n=1 Tax=unclassified Halomonas TaxID=2609666 RepID=UPI001CF1603C|nr:MULTISPECIES: DUF1499 domain-containing protein [unclassified Halomonas]MCA8863381.1 DUF1499 domain-containing protein [Halomonas sp. SBBP1]UZH08702.1 DUF1499 domain-containing protein [Halomonas sp. BDJS001]